MICRGGLSDVARAPSVGRTQVSVLIPAIPFSRRGDPPGRPWSAAPAPILCEGRGLPARLLNPLHPSEESLDSLTRSLSLTA